MSYLTSNSLTLHSDLSRQVVVWLRISTHLLPFSQYLLDGVPAGSPRASVGPLTTVNRTFYHLTWPTNPDSSHNSCLHFAPPSGVSSVARASASAPCWGRPPLRGDYPKTSNGNSRSEEQRSCLDPSPPDTSEGQSRPSLGK